MGRQANGGSGGIRENKRCLLVHGPRLLTVLLVISMIHVTASQDTMSTLDQGLNKIRSPRYAKTTGKTNTQFNRVCNTAECADVAQKIEKWMNLTVDPCENFYEFACGRYWLHNPLNETGKDYIDTFKKNEWIFQDYLKDKLEKGLAKLKGASDEVMKIPSDIYKSCMDLKAIESEGEAPLKKLIREFGGWSMVEENGEWDEKKWDFAKAILSIHRTYTSNGPLFLVKDWEDAADTTRYLFEIDQPPLKGSYSPPNVDAYRRLIYNVSSFLGGRTNLGRKVDELIDFESKLSNISLPPKLPGKTTLDERMTAAELQREMPTFNWYKHLQGLFAPKPVPTTKKFEVSSLSYLKSAMELVNNASKSVLSNYLVWHVIKDELQYMPKIYRDVNEQYSLETQNKSQPTNNKRWRKCIDYVNIYLTQDIVGAGFVADNLTKNMELIKKVKPMMTEVREAFKENIKSLTWIDDYTERVILDQVDSEREEPGFPKNLLVPAKVSKKFEKYKNLNIRDDALLSNRITIMKVKQKDMLAKFQEPMDQEEWYFMALQEASAGYNPYKNWITYPLLQIQPPFFYPVEGVRAVNFGSTGFIIGHEVAHSFGIRLRKFNKDGELKGQLWTNKSIEGFNARLPCFVKQYSQYYHSGIQVNGSKTLDENLSDANGIKAALKAYHNWAKLNPSETWLLPGLNFTNEQLFYIGYAQDWCYHGNLDSVKKTLETSIYPTPNFRVIGTLSNSCEFSNAFKCKINSPMNPVKKCALWSQKKPLF